jgi:hypothetical protein
MSELLLSMPHEGTKPNSAMALRSESRDIIVFLASLTG